MSHPTAERKAKARDQELSLVARAGALALIQDFGQLVAASRRRW